MGRYREAVICFSRRRESMNLKPASTRSRVFQKRLLSHVRHARVNWSVIFPGLELLTCRDKWGYLVRIESCFPTDWMEGQARTKQTNLPIFLYFPFLRSELRENKKTEIFLNLFASLKDLFFSVLCYVLLPLQYGTGNRRDGGSDGVGTKWTEKLFQYRRLSLLLPFRKCFRCIYTPFLHTLKQGLHIICIAFAYCTTCELPAWWRSIFAQMRLT